MSEPVLAERLAALGSTLGPLCGNDERLRTCFALQFGLPCELPPRLPPVCHVYAPRPGHRCGSQKAYALEASNGEDVFVMFTARAEGGRETTTGQSWYVGPNAHQHALQALNALPSRAEAVVSYDVFADMLVLAGTELLARVERAHTGWVRYARDSTPPGRRALLAFRYNSRRGEIIQTCDDDPLCETPIPKTEGRYTMVAKLVRGGWVLRDYTVPSDDETYPCAEAQDGSAYT